jgi:multidrug resistance efflux pump
MPLAFKLPDDSTDFEQALEAAEPQAPKPLKVLLLQAARELRAHRQLFGELAETLEHAASLRAGQMASQSRCDEIANEVRQALVSVAARLRSQA